MMIRALCILIALASVANAAPLRTPRAAAEAALPLASPHVRFLWNYPPQPDGLAGASFVVNSVVSRVRIPVKVVEVADGLYAFDLAACAGGDLTLAHLVKIWASLAEGDAYFHDRVLRAGKPSFVPAVHLGDAGTELEHAVGNSDPFTSFAPILRLDYAVVRLTSSIDGGKYLDFAGLVPGKTTLKDYAKSRGVDLDTAVTERLIMISAVTGKPRAITFALTASVRPTDGPGLIVITEDVFDGEKASDPFDDLLDFKADGKEVFTTLFNGTLEYTLFDGNNKLVAEAPPNLVSDHRVPEPFPRRLHGMISCVRCHAKGEMWQPAENQLAAALGDRLRLQGDRKLLVRLAELYSGDVDYVLGVGRDSLTRTVRRMTGTDVTTAALATARLYDSHEYEWIDARRAVVELGHDVQAGDETGVKTLRAIVPPLDPHGTTPDDPVLGLLMTDRLNVETGKREGLKVNRRQWERAIGGALERVVE